MTSPTHSARPIAGEILVVDDTPANLRLLCDLLSDQGHKVRMAPNGKWALTNAQNYPPDLILLDILMPEMDGFEVCRRLKADEKLHDIPVIFISALNEVFDKVTAFNVGGVDYVTKPFQVEEVLARVQTHLSLREVHLELEEQNRKLRESEEKYRSLTDNLPVGVYRTNLEGQILFANPALIQMLGYDTLEELQATTAVERYADPRDREHQLDIWSTHDSVVQQEITLHRKDGTILWAQDIGQVICDAAGDVMHIEGILQDITERKQAEQALGKSEEQLRILADNVPAYVAYVGVHDLCYRFVSRRFEEAYQMPRDRIVGQHIRDIIGESNYQFALQYIDVVRSGQRVSYVNVFEIAQGKRWIEVNYVPTFDDQGEVEGIVVLSFDITDRKQAEAEREQLIADLEAYGHTVAHDLKNPIGVILGFASYLKSDFERISPQEAKDHLAQIVGGSQRITRIIDELLLLASVRQLDEVETESLDMGHIVDEALVRLTGMIEKKQAEIIVPEKNAWPVALGYGAWIEEIWVNYLSNAIKYGGTPPKIELGATMQDDGMVRFWVQDNGPGLAPEEQKRLFTQFTRLDEARAQGHGLGLSIVKRIVEKLGGQVDVESVPGQGSVFCFTLPVPD